MKNNKSLNEAFYATLVMTGLSLVALVSGYITGGFLAKVELVLFPILGFFTKRGKKKAAIFLLALYLFDRVMLLINWGGHLTEWWTIVTTFTISFIFWSIFYKAYLTIKKLEESEQLSTQIENE